MSIRTTFAAFATAFLLGSGALVAGSVATATSADAGPVWHGKKVHHFGHHKHGWGHPGWGFRPRYVSGYYGYGGCYRVLRRGFVPGVGPVMRPVTICR